MNIWQTLKNWFRAIEQTPDARDDITPRLGKSPKNMRPSPLCVHLVKHFEGFYPAAYYCPANILTIGYGHTGLIHNDGTVYNGRRVTQEEAEKLLAYDLEKFGEKVGKLVTVPLEQHQFDALVSFAFNLGEGNLRKSTLLKKLNGFNYAGAAEEFMKWDKAAGKTLAGLTRRRKAERHLFATGELQLFA